MLLGPLVSERQYAHVRRAIAAARDAGATVAYGGERPDGFEKGYFLQPTILTAIPI
jgi:betaine-aldehyde dehydrogenase